MNRALLDVEGQLPSARTEDEADLPSPIQYQLVHAGRNGLELAEKLGQSALAVLPTIHQTDSR